MLSGFLSPETFAISIPVISIIGGVAIAIVAIVMSARKKELQHKERLLAMEKGVDVPPEPREEARPVYLQNRTAGLVMAGIGVSLTIALWVVAGAEGGVWGLIPLAIGLGLLLAAALERRESDKKRSQMASQRGV